MLFVQSPGISSSLAKFFFNIASFGWIGVECFFLWSILIFTKKKYVLSKKIFYPALFGPALLLLYIQWTDPFIVTFIEKPYGWLPIWADSIMVYGLSAYIFVYIGMGIFLCFHFTKKIVRDTFRKRLLNIIAAAVFISLVLSIITDILLPNIFNIHTPSSAHITSLIAASAYVYAIIRLKILKFSQKTAVDNIISTMPDCFLLLDNEGDITSMNPQALNMTGFSDNELKGKSIDTLFSDNESGYNLLDIITSEKNLRNLELYLKTKKGEQVPVRFSCSAMSGKNDINTGIICIIEDMTDYKIAQASINESRDRYRAIIDNIEDGYWEVDIAGNITLSNEAFLAIIGYSEDETIGMSYKKIMDQMNSKRIYLNFNRVYRTGNPGKVLNFDIIRKDGNRRTVETSISLKKDSVNRPIGFIGIMRDITERKMAEQQLQASEERYRLLADHVSDVIFTINTNLNLTYISPSIAPLTGYTPDDLIEKSIKEIITLASFKVVIKTIAEELKIEKKSLRKYATPDALELELKHKDGSTTWAEVKITVLRDEEGQAEKILGIARDISKRKNAEAELMKSFKVLRKTLNSTVQAIAMSVEARDLYTAGHQKQVAELAKAIAKEMGLSKDEIECIGISGAIHDLGKISIPAEILNKPSKLTDLEYRLIKMHPQTAYDILKTIDFPWPVAQIVYQHHERINGSGYPQGLSGADILLEAKILAVADVVEAMTAHRPYRASLGIKYAIEEISGNRGILYDPDVVDACIRLFNSGYQLTLQ